MTCFPFLHTQAIESNTEVGHLRSVSFQLIIGFFLLKNDVRRMKSGRFRIMNQYKLNGVGYPTPKKERER